VLERRILQHAAWIHYSTEQERTQADWISAGLPYRIIPNSTAIPVARADTGAIRRNVLFLSRLHPVKGLDLLLPAFARVRASLPEARLTIAGAGEPGFVRSLRAHAARLGLDSSIEWSGFLEGEEKQRAFLNADLFVLPSYSENFGLAAVEAMAHGIPVLLSDCVGVKCHVSEAGAGIVTPCEAGALAEAMQGLLENPALLRKMSENARNLVKTRYSQKTIATMLASEYAQLTRRDRAPA